MQAKSIRCAPKIRRPGLSTRQALTRAMRAGTAIGIRAYVVVWRRVGEVAVLLDINFDHAMADNLRRTIETDGDRVADLHRWRLGAGRSRRIGVGGHPERARRGRLSRHAPTLSVALASDDRGQARRMTGGERTRKRPPARAAFLCPIAAVRRRWRRPCGSCDSLQNPGRRSRGSSSPRLKAPVRSPSRRP